MQCGCIYIRKIDVYPTKTVFTTVFFILFFTTLQSLTRLRGSSLYTREFFYAMIRGLFGNFWENGGTFGGISRDEIFRFRG